jgi:hypothetical protein
MRRLAIAAAASLLAGCSPLLSAELEVPEIRITVPQQSFPATNPELSDLCAGLPGCIARPISYDVGAEVPVLKEDNVTFDIRVTDLAITLTSGSAGNLGGVESAKIMVLDAPDATTGTVVASYVRPSATAAPTSISVSGNSSVNVGSYLEAGLIPVRVEMTYDPAIPPPDFTADVEVGLSLVVTLDWGAYL